MLPETQVTVIPSNGEAGDTADKLMPWLAPNVTAVEVNVLKG